VAQQAIDPKRPGWRRLVLGAIGAAVVIVILASVLGGHNPKRARSALTSQSKKPVTSSSTFVATTTTAPPPTTTTAPPPTTTTAPPPTTTTAPPPTTTTAPAFVSNAGCTAHATPANDGYAGDYNVYVQSNLPYTNARAHDATDTYRYETNGRGDAVIYLWRQYPGEQITVTVGPDHCTTTA